MCLIYVAWRCHPRYRLVVAANRDECHARPTTTAHWWEDAPSVLAGRDLDAGGTWMGITRGGRFAAVTNYREPSKNRDAAGHRPDAPSRGMLVGAFLTGSEPAPDYLERIAGEGHRYNGFNLFAMDGETLGFVSNRARDVTCLAPGIFGLSNHLLDTPWPKVTSGKAELERLVAKPDVRVPDLFALLAPREPAREEALCTDTGSGLGLMQWRSSRFILGSAYGTRASTVVLLDATGAGILVERSFDARGAVTAEVAFDLDAGGNGPDLPVRRPARAG